MATRKLTPLAGAIASALVLGLSATAASGQSSAAQTSASRTQTDARTGIPAPATRASGQQAAMADHRASELMGRVVRSSTGEDLGRLSDMAVDMANKRIHYAIVSHGGVLGIGDKEVAVPVSRLQSGTRDRDLVINMTKEQLKDAPELGRSVKWNDPRTWDNIGQHYHQTLGMPANDRAAPGAGQTAGSAPAVTGTWPSRTDTRLVRASDVLGMDVIDSSGTEVGEIEDLVVDLSSGNIHYAVLEFDRKWNPNDKLVALPVDSFRLTPDGKDLTIDRTREQIASAPSFERREWPALSEFRSQVVRWGSSATGTAARSGTTSSTIAATSTPSTGSQGSSTTGSASSTASAPNSSDLTTAPQRSSATGSGVGSSASAPSATDASGTTAQGTSGTTGTSSQSAAAGAPGTPGADTATARVESGTTTGNAASTAGTSASDSSSSPAQGTSATTGMSQSPAASAAGTAGADTTAARVDSGATTGSGASSTSTPAAGDTSSASAPAGGGTASGNTAATPTPSTASGTTGSEPSSGVTGRDAQGSGAVGAASTALAIDASEFARLDTNGDGRLSRDEARAHPHLSGQWSTVDSNGDGYVSRDELDAAGRNARSSTPSSSGTSGGAASGSTPQPR